MLRYEILKKDINNIKNLNIVGSSLVDDGKYYLLECDKPHNLTPLSKINIGNELDIPIILSREIKVCITSDEVLHWKYVDDKFNEINTQTTNYSEGDDWDWWGLNEFKNYNGFEIELVKEDKIYQVKIIKDNSEIYQDIISEEQFDLFNDIGFNSDKMIIRELILKDNSFKIINNNNKQPFTVSDIFYVDNEDVYRTYDINFINEIFNENGDIKDKDDWPEMFIRRYNDGLMLPDIRWKGDGNFYGNDLVSVDRVDIESLYEPDDIDGDNYNDEDGGEYVIEEDYFEIKVEYELIEDKCDLNKIDFKITTLIPPEIGNAELIDAFLFQKTPNFDNVWVDEANYTITLPTSNSYDLTMQRNDYIENVFVKEEEKKAINDIIDGERIRYIPVRYKDNKYIEIEKIKFQFYFLNENKEYEDDVSEWDVLGIKNENIKYQHNKLKKTFIRTLYYDDSNPIKQDLMYYNTIFVNTNDMYKKYLLGNRLGDEDNEKGFPIEFEVSDKTKVRNSSNSSEGFFIYLFTADKPTTEPREMFLKVEFNSAINGQKYIFFNRKNDDGVDLDNIFFDKENEEMYIYNKMSYAYSEELDKYVYYLNEFDNITYEDDDTTMIIKLYEAKVK